MLDDEIEAIRRQLKNLEWLLEDDPQRFGEIMEEVDNIIKKHFRRAGLEAPEDG